MRQKHLADRLELDGSESLSCSMGGQIQRMDQRVQRLAATCYRETAWMRQIQGVGPAASLACAQALDNDPARLRNSRDGGAFVGLRPKQRESGSRSRRCRLRRTFLIRRNEYGCIETVQGNRKERPEDERPRRDGCESAAGSNGSLAVEGSRNREHGVVRPDPYLHRVQTRRQESAHASPVQVLNPQPSSFSSRLLTTRSLLMRAVHVSKRSSHITVSEATAQKARQSYKLLLCVSALTNSIAVKLTTDSSSIFHCSYSRTRPFTPLTEDRKV